MIPEAGAVIYRVEMKKQEERRLQPPEQPGCGATCPTVGLNEPPNFHPPGTSECDLIRNKILAILANIIKIRSYWIREGPKCNDVFL